jgi:hydrogenase maturation protease
VSPVLIAGIGNAWLRDDGFGGEVIKRLGERELPEDVTAVDFGTGGLDLAYEVMRGYEGLVLVDVSRQGEPPGTLYVMEPDPEEISAGIEDGEIVDPHSMDPQTVLRFVKTMAGWPGKVVVIACEPESVEEMGLGLSEAVGAAVERAADLALKAAADVRVVT